MPYTEQSLKQLAKSVQKIESRKEHQYAAPTYKDTAELSKIAETVESWLETEKSWDKNTLDNSIFFVRYLANAYGKMWRCALSVKYYNMLIKLLSTKAEMYSETDEESFDDYYSAVRARNYYSYDSCDDLSEFADKFLPNDVKSKIENEVLSRKSGLRHDPTELSDEYLAVIDEVEQRIDEANTGDMHNFERIKLKSQLLKEYGIDWKSEIELNPNVRFD